MTLHEAIREVLLEKEDGLTSSEIAEIINRKKLYKRKDGNPVPASQISARIDNYSSLFSKKGNLIKIKVFDDLDFFEIKLQNELLKLADSLRANFYYNTDEFLELILIVIVELDKSETGVISISDCLENVKKNAAIGDRINFKAEDSIISIINLLRDFVIYPNRTRLIQELIYWIEDGRESSILLPEYICNIIGELDIYAKHTFLHICLNSLPNFELSIQEINPQSKFLTIPENKWWNKKIAKLEGLMQIAARCEMQFFNSKIDAKSEAKHVAIYCPPWNLKDNNSEWPSEFTLIRDAIVHQKKTLDKAVIIVPDSVLFQGGKSQKARVEIMSLGCLEAVISLPFKSNATAILSASLVFLDFTKKNENVFFADFNHDGINDIENNWNFLVDTYNAKLVQENQSAFIPKEVIFENGYDWSPKKYLNEKLNLEPKHGHKIYTLAHLLNFHTRGKNIDRSLLYAGGESKYIRTTDLNKDGIYLNLSEKVLGIDYDQISDNKNLIREGLLVSLVGKHIKPNLIQPGQEVLLDKNVVALMVKDKVVLPEFLATELNQDYVLKQLDSVRRGNTIPFMLLQDLLQLKLQIPPIHEQKELLYQRAFADKNTSGSKLSIDQTEDKVNSFDYIATLKHTLKQQLTTLSSDLKNLNAFLEQKDKANEIIKMDNIIVPPLQGEESKDLSLYSLTNTFGRMSRSLKNAHNILDKAEDALRIEKIEKTHFEIKEFLETISKGYANIEITVRGKKQEIHADKSQIEMVFENLIENAEKHGFKGEPKPWKIDININPQKINDPILIEIKNNGKPFQKDFETKDFTSKGKKAGEFQGTGFGGYLIKEIIKKHNGSLDIIPAEKLERDGFNVKIIITLPKI